MCNPFVFAHSAFKMSAVMAAWREEMASMVLRASGLVVSEFIQNYTSQYDAKESKKRIDFLHTTIVAKFSGRLSLFGLIHALELLGAGEAPCDVVFERGYNPQLVQRALNQYIAHCRKEYETFMQRIEMEEYDRRTQEIAKDPATRQAVKETMEKFAQTFGAKPQKEPELIRSRYEGHPQREFSRQVTPEVIEQTVQAQIEYVRRKQIEEFGEDAHIDFD